MLTAGRTTFDAQNRRVQVAHFTISENVADQAPHVTCAHGLPSTTKSGVGHVPRSLQRVVGKRSHLGHRSPHSPLHVRGQEHGQLGGGPHELNGCLVDSVSVHGAINRPFTKPVNSKRLGGFHP